jgi:drug/metabolite transporter (DMT)-like permease
MLFLALSIVASSLIFLIFRLFNKYEVDNLSAIITNYFVAASCGFLYKWPESNLYSYPWFWSACFLGLVFILLFVVMAKVTQENGISIAAVCNKLSVVIPVLFAVFFLKERLTIYTFLGIGLSLIGTYMALFENNQNLKRFVFPLILFVGSGFLDTFLKYNQTSLVEGDSFIWFTSSIFLFAGIFGLSYLVLFKRKGKVKFRSVLWGSILGVPNFFSILLLLWTLDFFSKQSAMVFPINNVGVVIVSSVLSFILFSEKRSRLNKLGLVIASIGILLIGFNL